MNILEAGRLEGTPLPGRVILKAVGKDGPSVSGEMTVGFARYDAEQGPMRPHRHAEECVYVLDARDGWTRFGPTAGCEAGRTELRAGMLLHIPEGEWHVFEHRTGGFVEAMFIYGQVDDIRPEEAE